MLLFLFIAFNLGLLALAAGVLLSIWGLRTNEIGATTAKIAGILISVLAIAGLSYLGANMVRALADQPAPPQRHEVPRPVQGAEKPNAQPKSEMDKPAKP